MFDLKKMRIITEEKDEDTSLFVETQTKPKEFQTFVSNLIDDLRTHFRVDMDIHMTLYKNNDITGLNPNKWEMLFHLSHGWKRSDFADELNSFKTNNFDDHPVDICRYRIRRRLN